MLLIPSDIRDAIADCGAKSGVFDIAVSDVDGLLVVTGWSYRSVTHGNVHRRNFSKAFTQEHFLQSGTIGNGFWYRLDDLDLHQQWVHAVSRDVALKIDSMRRRVTGWYTPGGTGMLTPILTFCEVGDQLSVLAWEIIGDSAIPIGIDVADLEGDRLAPVREHWPVKDLEGKKIVVLGTGSIGSAACTALASYGARDLTLVDPDHLSWRNLARHAADASQVGRRKVRAVKQLLQDHDAAVHADVSTANVVTDADEVRDLLEGADILLVCTDGVEPRRVANHLAARAGVPTVFACVLADGAVGEVLRTLPGGTTGCLICHRLKLADDGVFDPEPSLDRGYGTGSRHLPMTAIGGDLALVGQLAAKAVVATLLHRAGHFDQQLPGEHAVIGLRSASDLPAPFNAGLGATIWTPAWSSHPECPTCNATP